MSNKNIKLVMSADVEEFKTIIRQFMKEHNLRIFQACYEYPSSRFEMYGCSMALSKIKDCLIEVEDEFGVGELTEIKL